MADTVYEEFHGGGYSTHRGELLANIQVKIAFTRFWKGKEDGVQITVRDAYVMMPISEFRKAVQAIEKNVEETKDAWWHKLGKNGRGK